MIQSPVPSSARSLSSSWHIPSCARLRPPQGRAPSPACLPGDHEAYSHHSKGGGGVGSLACACTWSSYNVTIFTCFVTPPQRLTLFMLVEVHRLTRRFCVTPKRLACWQADRWSHQMVRALQRVSSLISTPRHSQSLAILQHHPTAITCCDSSLKLHRRMTPRSTHILTPRRCCMR